MQMLSEIYIIISEPKEEKFYKLMSNIDYVLKYIQHLVQMDPIYFNKFISTV